MKKILSILFVLILAAPAAYAADDYRKELYFTINRGFEEIETKDIVTSSDSTSIYTDSGDLTAEIKAYTVPLNSTQRPIEYSCESPHIQVDESGKVKSDGTPGVYGVNISSGDITRVHNVYVGKKIERLTLSDTELSMYADSPQAYKISAVTEPSDAGTYSIRWYSADESIVYVDENGTVIPNGVGTTSVYAKTADGEHTAKCTVYVGLYDVRAKAVFITNAVDKIRSGAQYSLSSYIYPEMVNDKSVVWSSSNSNVLSVDQNGVIRGGETGKATITVRSASGKTDTCEIEVVPASEESVDYKVISKSVSERITELMSEPDFTAYDMTLSEMTQYQLSLKPVKYSENRLAEYDELYDEIDPSRHASGYGKYQFIDLSASNNVSADVLDNYLKGKGVLSGKGKQFKEAADKYGISELYLVTHACLETGDGFSQLASGVLVNGVTVYNVFGIGAYDENAVKYGSEYAYDYGWTSIDAAIDGGAAWISANYINNPHYRQNTLYKMRWNPDSPGEHQYATDIEWATAQAKTLKNMFDAFPDADLSFEIPLYEGENKFDLK